MKSKTIECHGISVRAGRDHAATADQGRAILKRRIFFVGLRTTAHGRARDDDL